MIENRIKVRGGTVRNDNQALCFSCRHSCIIKNSQGATHIRCNELCVNIQEKVVSCSSYHDKGKPELWQLEKIAWHVETDKNRGYLGFQPPSKQRSEAI